MSRFDCTVVGDVFFDIPASGFDRQFMVGGTSYCVFSSPTPGGSGNVSVGISTLGGKAAFVGKAGNDVFGKQYEQDLTDHGVFSKVFFDPVQPTGLVLAVIEDRQRSFIVSRGANDQLSLSEIEKAEATIADSKFVYFCGYSLVHEPQKSAVLFAIKRSKDCGAKIVFDPGAYNIILSDRPLFLRLLQLCDVVSLNIDEAKALTGKTNCRDMIREISRYVPLAVLKCGGEGSLLFAEGKTFKTKGFRVKCVDTTGAGDAFASALIYGLSHNLSLEQTCKLGNWFAAQVVRGVGARCFPSKLEVNDFRRELGILNGGI